MFERCNCTEGPLYCHRKNRCYRCGKRKRHGMAWDSGDPKPAEPTQESADLATLHRYFEAHPHTAVAAIPFEDWTARILHGESVAGIIDKARGTIEADILDEELRRLYDAQTAGTRCSDSDWRKRMALPKARAIRKGENSLYAAMQADPNYPWDCGVSDHVCAFGEAVCVSCGTAVEPPTEPAEPKPRCDHSWETYVMGGGKGPTCVMCTLCGAKRSQRPSTVESRYAAYKASRHTRGRALRLYTRKGGPSIPGTWSRADYDKVLLTPANILSIKNLEHLEDRTRGGPHGLLGAYVEVQTRDGRTYRGDHGGFQEALLPEITYDPETDASYAASVVPIDSKPKMGGVRTLNQTLEELQSLEQRAIASTPPGLRLIATNMALNGSPVEEAVKYATKTFGSDPSVVNSVFNAYAQASAK